MQRRTFLGALGSMSTLGATTLGSKPTAFAQNYPNAPVKIIVPYTAGGGADAVARLLGQGMGEELKQSFIVDNRAGAGGMVGAEAVARSTPDGYTLLFAGNPELTITPWLKKASYAPLTDFKPIVLVAQSPSLLVTNASLGAKDLRAALEAARKSPAGLTIGTPGNGTPHHIAVEMLRSQTGMDILHVPYKGAGPVTIAVFAGEVSFALVGAPPILPHVGSGKVVALAVTQPRRSPLVPEVPTLGEAIGLMRNDDFVAWYGLLVPSSTAPEVVQQLEKAAFAVLKRSDTKAKFATLGTDLVAMPSAQFAERIRIESKLFGEVIKRFSIKGA